MDYSLRVDIDPVTLLNYHQAGYKLCVAKKVNNQYNVVWSAQRGYLTSNRFDWKESYKVFGTQPYEPTFVQAVTSERDIAFGQKCVLAGDNMFPATGNPDHSGVFSVQNQGSNLAVGIDCPLRYAYTLAPYSPISVTLFPSTGLCALTPATTLLLWFDPFLSTGIHLAYKVTNGFELYYGGTTSHTVFFDGNWHIVTGDEPNIVPPLCVLLSHGTRLALDRGTESETAVVGDEYKEGSPDQEWTIVPSPTEGYFNIEGASSGTYLSIDGEPEEGTPVIHGPTKMDWKVEHADGGVRLLVPDTDYCVKLGRIISPHSKKKAFKVKLAERAHEKRELWTIHYLPPDDTAEE